MELRNNRDRSADVVQHGGRQHRGVRHRKHREDSAQSEAPGMHGNFTRENRETPSAPAAERVAGRLEKAMEPGVQHARRWGVGRLRNTVEVSEHRWATAPRTQSRISELSDLHGVRKAARKDKRTRFTALLHHVTVSLLRDSYY